MRPRLPLATVVAACATVLGPSLAAQFERTRVVFREDAAVDRAVRWAAAIVAHRPGVVDADVEEVAQWSAPAVADLAIEVSVIRKLMRDPRAHEFDAPITGPARAARLTYTSRQLDRLRGAGADAAHAGLGVNDVAARGVLLHTDVALLAARGGIVLEISDGRALGVERGGDQWALARLLAASLDERSGRLADARVWYRATLAALTAADTWNARHAEAAVAQFAADPDLLFLAGTIHEALASPRVQAAVAAAAVPADVTISVRSPQDELRRAASLLERAVAAAPGSAAARIHYGRVLTLLDRPPDAVTMLVGAAAGAKTDDKEPEQQYYAQLFLGAALDAANRRDEARRAYTAAAALFPRAQSPHLALSALAARDGDRAEARRAIEPVLALRGDPAEREDPWWNYIRSPGRDADALMADARARLAALHREAAPR